MRVNEECKSAKGKSETRLVRESMRQTDCLWVRHLTGTTPPWWKPCFTFCNILEALVDLLKMIRIWKLRQVWLILAKRSQYFIKEKLAERLYEDREGVLLPTRWPYALWADSSNACPSLACWRPRALTGWPPLILVQRTSRLSRSDVPAQTGPSQQHEQIARGNECPKSLLWSKSIFVSQSYEALQEKRRRNLKLTSVVSYDAIQQLCWFWGYLLPASHG